VVDHEPTYQECVTSFALGAARPPHKELKLTKPGHFGASQLNSSFGLTRKGARSLGTERNWCEREDAAREPAVTRVPSGASLVDGARGVSSWLGPGRHE
jgi:hypothetical protein